MPVLYGSASVSFEEQLSYGFNFKFLLFCDTSHFMSKRSPCYFLFFPWVGFLFFQHLSNCRQFCPQSAFHGLSGNCNTRLKSSFLRKMCFVCVWVIDESLCLLAIFCWLQAYYSLHKTQFFTKAAYQN
jgi:hypothetical protein